MSNTEPLLRLNVEARTPEAVNEIVDEIGRHVAAGARRDARELT